MKHELSERFLFRQSAGKMWYLIVLTYKTRPVLTTVWTGLLLLLSGVPALQIWLQKLSVDSISQIDQGQLVWKGAAVLIIALYLSNLFLSFFSEIQNYIFTIIREDANHKLKTKIIQKTIRIPLSYFEHSDFYNRMRLAHEAANRNGTEAVKHMFTVVQQLISLISVFAILAVVHWTLPFALMISSLPGVIFLLIAKKSRYKIAVQTTPVGREMEYTFRLIVKRESAKEIRLFNLGEILLERWSKLFFQVRTLFIQQAGKEGIGRIIGSFFLQISSLAVALLLVWQIQKGQLTIGDYVALMGAVLTVQGILGGMGMNLGSLFETSLYINNLFDFLNTEEKTNHKGEALPFPKESYSKIIVKGLAFNYPNQEYLVLDDISFTINRGEKVAIVGENGAGKSTLINCLLGLYQPSRGDIYFDNIEISDIDISSFRENVAAVFQDFVHYHYTVRENIGFGQVNEMWNDERLIEVIEKVGLKSVVEKYPNGLATLLGREFQGGQELSGGQWQRIAIARAFIRNADILVLDEPTSALDPEAELEIFKFFQELSQGKTAFMISHRLGPARFADKILVLKDGKLVEEGNHDQLILLNGEYARMFRAQANWYQDIEDFPDEEKSQTQLAN